MKNICNFAADMASAHEDGEKWKLSLLSKEWDYALKVGCKDGLWFAKFKPMGCGKCMIRRRNAGCAKVSTLGIESGDVTDALMTLTKKMTEECLVIMIGKVGAMEQTVQVADLFTWGKWVAVYDGAKIISELERSYGPALVGTRWV